MPACNACVPTTAFEASCDKRTVGGNSQQFYVIPFCQIVSITEGYSDGRITDIDTGSDLWLPFFAYRDTIDVTEPEGNENSGSVNQQIVMTLNKFAGQTGTDEEKAQAARNAVNEITNPNNRVSVLIQDNSGIWRFYGQDSGMDVRNESVSGAGKTDLAGYSLTFDSGTSAIANVVEQAFIDTIATV